MPSIADGDDFDDAAFESKLTTALTEEVGTTEEATAEPETDAPTDEVDKVEEPETEAAPDDTPILGKFKSVDDLTEAYTNLEKQFHGSAEQRREYEELRDQMAQLTQAVQQQPAAGFNWETEIEERPLAALEAAARTGNSSVYLRVKEQVNEYHSGIADIWENNQRVLDEMQQLRSEVTSRYEPVAQSVQKDEELREYQAAWQSLTGKYADARDLVDAIRVEGENNPGLNATDKNAYFDNLYWLAKAKQAGTHQAAVQQVQDEQKAQADQDKRSATVTSASSSGDHKQKTAVEAWKEDFGAFLQEEPTSISAGLTTD